MLSETLYKRMMLDKEFVSSMSKVGTIYESVTTSENKTSLSETNSVFYKYHKSAFELSLLFSPRASKIPSSIGDFLLTIGSIAKLGKTYISNLKWLISVSDLKKSHVKRLDKVNIGLDQMLETFESLESDVESSINKYITLKIIPPRQTISRYSKSLLYVRRSYFRMRRKLELVEKYLDFSQGSYQPYEPLMILACSRQSKHSNVLLADAVSLADKNTCNTKPINISEYIEAISAYDALCNHNKRKEYLDIAKTAFIANYKLPRDAVVKHLNISREFSTSVVYDTTTNISEGNYKPRIYGLKSQQ